MSIDPSSFLQRAVDTMSGGLWVFDAFGDIELQSEGAARHVAADAPTELGFAQLFPELCFHELLFSTERVRVDTVLRTASGARLPVWAASASLDHARLVLDVVDLSERHVFDSRRASASKFQAIGQLAAGVAHEVNTPMQFIGDGVRFLEECISELTAAHRETTRFVQQLRIRGGLTEGDERDWDVLAARADLDFVYAEAPQAVDRTLRGIQRVAEIVRALRTFANREEAEVLASLTASITWAPVGPPTERPHELDCTGDWK